MSFDLKIRNRDLAIGSNGDFEQIVDNNKLIQDLLKILLTPLGGNPFHAFYGSMLSEGMIGQALDNQFTVTIAENQLQSSLNTLMAIQKAQENSGQAVSPGELLAALKEVHIARHPMDPTYFNITVGVLTKALDVIYTEFDVTL